jgi:oxygen-dependent protoporphyrinogen oxidase
VTVMMGGHYWKAKSGSGIEKSLVPRKEDLPIQALETLRLHGLVPNDVEPVASHAQIQADCIPQYAVGHVERMQDLNKALHEQYNGRLGVVGSSYSGVGINDCVLSSWRHAKTLVETGHATGLEHYNRM